MASDSAKVLFYKGFSSRYALVTTYYTYPEPTPVTQINGRRTASGTSSGPRGDVVEFSGRDHLAQRILERQQNGNFFMVT